jgi:hypothetical protein
MSDYEEVEIRPGVVIARDDDGKPINKRKRGAKAQPSDEIKLNGLDRTPGWHKKKNLPHMVNLGNWVRRSIFFFRKNKTGILRCLRSGEET